MDTLFERLPEIITAAAQSQLGILALLSVALAVLAYFFFAKASEKARIGIFVLLFLGVCGFATAMFQASADDPVAGSSPALEPLSTEAKAILAEAAEDPGGLVAFERFGASVDLHSNGVSLFTDKGDHRALVKWEAAIEQLIEHKLLVALGDRGDLFEITKKGYDVAASL